MRQRHAKKLARELKEPPKRLLKLTIPAGGLVKRPVTITLMCR